MLPEPNPLCVQVEKFFLPFELACHSKTPKIVCSALDSIEKLVAYGHISYEFFEVRIFFFYYLLCMVESMAIYFQFRQIDMPPISSRFP